MDAKQIAILALGMALVTVHGCSPQEEAVVLGEELIEHTIEFEADRHLHIPQHQTREVIERLERGECVIA